MIVIHATEGDREATESWFKSPKSKVSAHYLVCKDGTVVQFVNQFEVAWHAGEVVSPTAKKVLERKGVNPNLYSIGIEHESNGTEDLTAAQRASSIELIRELATAWNFPINRDSVVGHHEIKASKSCPGQIDVDLLVTQAASDAHPASPNIQPPVVVWSNFFGCYLIATRRVSNDEWYFVKATELPAEDGMFLTVTGHRAGAPFSEMPR